MLHSALPRVYLATPGLGYASGRFLTEELRQSYSYAEQRLEDSYVGLDWYGTPMPLEEPRRDPNPSPLDLSLKPPPTPSTGCDDCEAIEVDDDEDRHSREVMRPHSLDELDEPEPTTDHYYDQQIDYATQLDESYQETQRKPSLLSPGRLRTPPTPHIHAPMTPPSTPSPPQCPRRRGREEEAGSAGTSPRPEKYLEKGRAKRKHARKLKFDEDTSSPVSGTVILRPDEAVVTGDIDPAFNIVEVTEEARAELAKIENRLGPYQCKLCRQLHEDAFQLAQHRCSRIAHVEYRCPECDKRFSCPANLASHRRWHKPRPAAPPTMSTGSSSIEELSCARCDARFGKHANLRKHLTSQHPGELVGDSSETA
ncbi:PREDICTED: insulinoma-associated protein 1a-like [Ceratosolen solmsi marchali]|uniref:Insulinoma-associated protein 1a-like n=1 Tax=Ceratosolen solmsi marchali TaxID=326594 RepID=A0AAJ6YEE0_9HYME|nr:PREDICTED: insulinoma-associated protein 1a-like [Ceratosolen solmsi marchali]